MSRDTEVKHTNPFQESKLKPKSAEEIYSELAKSRAFYEQGRYEDFDEALEEISKKYDL